jgi:hypothetical protein
MLEFFSKFFRTKNFDLHAELCKHAASANYAEPGIVVAVE